MPVAILKTTANSFGKFVQNEAFSGILLITSAAIALLWANSPFSEQYFGLWQTKFTIGFGESAISKPLILWINDGLMAFFFFVVGLEIKREIIVGELSSLKKASLPIFAAIGGMLVPALFFVLFNLGKESISGWGIPMATDIAFSLGILALLGTRVPLSLKIFLTALAIVDDLGAVLVIALFYSSKLSLANLSLGILFLLIMVLMNRLGVRNMLAYGLIGIVGVWLAFLLSGIHATIAGILAALTIPASTKIDTKVFKERLNNLVLGLKSSDSGQQLMLSEEQQDVLHDIKETCSHYEAPLQSLEHALHPWVVYLIMPVFALSNAGVQLSENIGEVLFHPISLGIAFGLLIGKPVGIFLLSWLAVRFGFASLPENTNWRQILGLGLLAGIGFTMSLFISSLAFTNPEWITAAKVGILMGSILAGFLGYMLLRYTLKDSK
jgi:NhaA family Na+:H+ antiporter